MARVALNENVYHGRQVAEPVRRIRVEFDRLKAQRDIMVQMLNGADSGQASNFSPIAAAYVTTDGTEQERNTAAKLLFDEINSTVGNAAALEQFLAITG